MSRAATAGPATMVAIRPATGIEIASPLIPVTWSPTRWVSRMYAAQHAAAASANATPTGSAAPVQGWVSSSTPTAATSVHQRPAPWPRAHRDPERAEELQRARSTQRQPGQRGHEQQGDRPRSPHRAVTQARTADGGEVTAPRPGEKQAAARPAQARRSQAAPSAPSSSISPTDTARPIWTLSMETTAIEAPVRAVGCVMTPWDLKRTVRVHVNSLDIPFINPERSGHGRPPPAPARGAVPPGVHARGRR